MGTANLEMPPARLAAAPHLPTRAGRSAGAILWLACLTLAAMFVCARRLAGHVGRPLPPAGALFALAVVLVGMLAAQLLWTRDQRHRHVQAAFNVFALATLALWCIALLDGQPVWLWLTAATVIAATIGMNRARNLFQRRLLTPFNLPLNLTPFNLPLNLTPFNRPLNLTPSNLQRKRRRPRFVLRQELIRGRSSSGTDVLVGRVRETVAVGQRTAVIHVAFCPPFSQAPKLAVRQTGGPAARVKVGPLWAHGARLEFKLSQAAAQASAVCLSLSARG